MITEEIQQSFQNIISELGIRADVSVAQDLDSIKVQIDTKEDASLLIGYHAETLLSLQRIFTIIASKRLGEKANLLIDINDYRTRQHSRLKEIATSACQRCIDENRPVLLRGFSSYERRIIHDFVTTEFPSLTSFSEGETPNRVMFIKQKEN